MSGAKTKVYFASAEDAAASAQAKLLRLRARGEWAFLLLRDSSFVNAEILAVDDDVRGGCIVGDLVRLPILFKDIVDVDKGTKPAKRLGPIVQAMRGGR